jgi:hypothetical protein
LGPKGHREIVVSNIIWIVVIGFIAGIIARFLSPGLRCSARAVRLESVCGQPGSNRFRPWVTPTTTPLALKMLWRW